MRSAVNYRCHVPVRRAEYEPGSGLDFSGLNLPLVTEPTRLPRPPPSLALLRQHCLHNRVSAEANIQDQWLQLRLAWQHGHVAQ
ncbi:hypothetical protein VTK26DRAFT_607 [Humicola hyalothermophila]